MPCAHHHPRPFLRRGGREGFPIAILAVTARLAPGDLRDWRRGRGGASKGRDAPPVSAGGPGWPDRDETHWGGAPPPGLKSKPLSRGRPPPNVHARPISRKRE